MDFTPLFPLSELPLGGMKARQGILVARLADGTLHAVDNACPHQGYPLVQGGLQGCVLTCTWHNFKFDVRSGACLIGEEAVPKHEVEVRDGVVHVRRRLGRDLDASWRSLATAMERHQMSRAAREVARLLEGRVDAPVLLAWGAAWDADRGEYGPGHSAALAADLLGWLPSWNDLEATTQIVTEGLDLASETVVGLPVRARPAAERIPSLYEARSDNEVAARVAELRARVEREDAAGAEALLRGMLQAGWEQRQVQAALYALVADHFLDFGHPLIYVKKTLDLLDATRWANADSLLGGLVFGIVSGTREDLLPPWAAFRRRWDEWAATALPTLPPPESRTRDRQIEEDLVLGLRTGSPGEAFAAFAARLEAGDWTSAVNALSLAAADRLLRFEPAHDADPTIEEGWLHVTHRLTVANAVRHAVVRAEPRDAARILLMAVHFVRLAVGLDGAESTEPPADGATPDPRALRQRVLAGRAHRPIFWAHDVKTLVAAEEEARFLGDDRPLRAAARYLGHPLQERVIARFAHEAARLVRDGKPPRQLSG